MWGLFSFHARVYGPLLQHRLLLGMVANHRYTGDRIDAELAKSEAQIIREAVEEKRYSDDEVVRVLTTRSKLRVAAILNRYKEEYGVSLTKQLGDEEGDEFLEALRMVIQCTTDHKKYYEKVVRKALKGMGTDKDALTRVIVGQAERDLRDIKELYLKKNNVSLNEDVAEETSGDYKHFLLTLLGHDD